MDKKYLEALPELILINLDRHEDRVCELENDLDVNIYNSELLAELIESISVSNKAINDLEYYCLSLLTSKYYDAIGKTNEFKELLNYIRQTGLFLLQDFLTHKLYINNHLAYTLVGIKPKCLYMKRRDLFMQDLKNELLLDEFNRSVLLDRLNIDLLSKLC